jgi:hypothetical protein
MERPSSAERAYLERIDRDNRALETDGVPASLAEMFERLERIRRSHGALARPGVGGSDDGDLAAHLAFLERRRMIERRGANDT